MNVVVRSHFEPVLPDAFEENMPNQQ